MAVIFPIPPREENWADQQFAKTQENLVNLMKNVFDPHGNSLVPKFEGVDRPQGLPEMIGNSLIPGSMKEALVSGMIGMGPMPLGLIEKPVWSIPKNNLIKEGNLGFKAADSDALIHYAPIGTRRIRWNDEIETLREVPINKLRPDQLSYIRDNKVAEYASKGEFPPIEATLNKKGTYDIEDGSTRYHAAKSRNDKNIKVWVSELNDKGTIKRYDDYLNEYKAKK